MTISPSIVNIFWNTPCVAGWIGPRLRVVYSVMLSALTKGLPGTFVFCSSIKFSSMSIALFGPLTSEILILFICSCSIFQWIFPSHGEIIHFIYIQYAFQVRMSFEKDSIIIIGLTLHPIG